jgi:hypothetical protein
MSDLLLHLLSVPHRVNFLRLGRHGELCERNYRFYANPPRSNLAVASLVPCALKSRQRTCCDKRSRRVASTCSLCIFEELEFQLDVPYRRN